MDEIRETIKDYILKEFLPGENPENLKDDTQLISGGVLDSLATLKLVMFLEERYKIRIEAHEANVEHLNTITEITDLVQTKLG
jgi:acyl carrier protein